MTGDISLSAVNEIEHQIALFEQTADKKQALPALEEMIDAVFHAQRQDDLSVRSVVADLYIIAQDGTEYFFEMKSPMPNKGQCLEVTQRILRFHLVRNLNRPTVYGYFAMAYNPYGPTREDYKWSFARGYMPFDQAVVIGQEFWTISGGPTAYEELLEIYAEVGREKMEFMIDSLAFGF